MLLDDNFQNDEEVQSFLYSVGEMIRLRCPDLHCDLHNTQGHDKFTCDLLVNFVLLSEAVRKDPSLKEKVIRKYKYLVRRYKKNQTKFASNNKSFGKFKKNNSSKPVIKVMSVIDELLDIEDPSSSTGMDNTIDL